MTPRAAGNRRVLPGSPFNQRTTAVPQNQVFSIDDRVSHDRYGLGTVVGLEEEEGAVLVDFGSGTRRIALPNPKLVKL